MVPEPTESLAVDRTPMYPSERITPGWICLLQADFLLISQSSFAAALQ